MPALGCREEEYMGRVEIKKEIKRAFTQEYGFAPKSSQIEDLVVTYSIDGARAYFRIGSVEYSFISGRLRRHA